MKNVRGVIVGGVLVCSVLAGCRGIGTKRVLFYTRSNVGLDISGAPPTLEATIARKEGVIEPVFEGGETLPVIASFRSDVKGPLRIFAGVAMTFATSQAALALAAYQGDVRSYARAIARREEDDVLDASLTVSAGSAVTARASQGELVARAAALERARARLDTEQTSLRAALRIGMPNPASGAAADVRRARLADVENELATADAQLALTRASLEVLRAEAAVALADAAGRPAAVTAHGAALAAEAARAADLRARGGVPASQSSGGGEVDVSELQGPGKVAPLFFATDSALGLKIGFDAALVPTSFVFGFNRKELAYSPVTAKARADGRYDVAMPSVLASVNSATTAEEKAAGLEYQQYFATGKAAVYLAANKDVREAFSKKLLPKAGGAMVGTAFLDATFARIYDELVSIRDDTAEPQARRDRASFLLTGLDGLGAGTDPKIEIVEQDRAVTPIALRRRQYAKGNEPAGKELAKYSKALQMSIDLIDKALRTPADYTFDGNSGANVTGTLEFVRECLTKEQSALAARVAEREADSGALRLAREFLFGEE
jgi:hypothetical protein